MKHASCDQEARGGRSGATGSSGGTWKRHLERQLETFDAVLAGRPARLAGVLGAFIVALWLLVPLHELLHVTGCLLSGGSVSELELSPLFGGRVLEHVFPWVVAGGDNAGRLTGFVPAGDLSYLMTVLLPYLVLAPAGALAARRAVRRQSALGFGAALAAAGQPVAGAFGDFYEAAAIPTTTLFRSVGIPWAMELRGDDLQAAAAVAAGHGITAWAIMLLCVMTGLVLAGVFLWLSGGIAPAEAAPPG